MMATGHKTVRRILVPTDFPIYRPTPSGRRWITPRPGVDVSPQIEIGDPAERIMAFARSSGCDLIVMGTHRRQGLSRVLLGSVAAKVLRRAPCPVLTVRGVDAAANAVPVFVARECGTTDAAPTDGGAHQWRPRFARS